MATITQLLANQQNTNISQNGRIFTGIDRQNLTDLHSISQVFTREALRPKTS